MVFFFDIWTPKKSTNTRPKKPETYTGGRVFDVQLQVKACVFVDGIILKTHSQMME